MKIVYQNPEALTFVKQSEEESELGTYGRKWLKFMREYHPKLVREMQSKGILYKMAQSVDDMAWDYRDLLDQQYAQTHPRPKEFYEVVAWERVKDFHTDSAVMRDKILIPRSAI
jgi:hypothetical protein